MSTSSSETPSDPAAEAATTAPGWTDHLIGVALAAVTVAVLVATMDLGFTRDEGYYFKAAELYLGWFKELAGHLEAGSDWRASFEQASIDRHWGYNGEHPALPKALFGLSAWVFHEWLGWLSYSTAMRLPAALCAGLLSYLVYLFGAQRWGRAQGAFAAAATLLMPRPFFHAHLACFDYPMTLMWFLVLYGYWRSLRSASWGWATGLFFGLALSTKLNAFFLPIVVVAHWALVYGPRTRLLKAGDGWRVRIPPVPVALLSMASVGPLVWYLLWPRHWFDTFNRVWWFMSFHLNHVHYFQSYFGQNLYAPPFPVEFPVALTLVTVPEVTQLAWAVGAVILVGRWARSDGGAAALEPLRRPLRERFGETAPDPTGSGWWLLLGGVLPVAIIAQPDTPIFGGIKHWMPAMPFMALVASVAAARGAEAAASWLTGDREGWGAARAAIVALLLSAWLTPAALACVHAHGYNTSFYNTLIGGTRGAADLGMQRQFWGYTVNHALGFLNERVSEGGSVFFQNTNLDSVRTYQREGRLREDIRYGRTPTSGELGFIHDQKAARNLELELWTLYQTQNPAFVSSYDGVPVLTIYPNRSREAAQRFSRERLRRKKESEEEVKEVKEGDDAREAPPAPPGVKLPGGGRLPKGPLFKPGLPGLEDQLP